MIVAFSTSSPVSSVALLSDSGNMLASAKELAPMAASGACIRMLERLLVEAGSSLHDATLFLADLGPGSFTGVRVGVTLAKTFAMATRVQAGGADSFDLIAPNACVVLPSKRGEWFVREPGLPPARSERLPSGPIEGYGPGLDEPRYPDAGGFAALLEGIARLEPELLVPCYLVEPAISQPKKPFAMP